MKSCTKYDLTSLVTLEVNFVNFKATTYCSSIVTIVYCSMW